MALPTEVVIRPLARGDRDTVRRLLEATQRFTREEIQTAVELIDEWITRGESSDYMTYVLEERTSAWGAVRGYVCYGPTPLTEGTYDLYWIAVDPASQGRGYGHRLLAYAETRARVAGGRMMLIETSSQESYGSTVRFYERAGYKLGARIPDYYRVGDDKLIYLKVFSVEGR